MNSIVRNRVTLHIFLAPITTRSQLNGHGANVEISDLGFVEGVWNAAFVDYAFDKINTSMGTGERIRDSKSIVSTPSHRLDRIYYTKLNHFI